LDITGFRIHSGDRVKSRWFPQQVGIGWHSKEKGFMRLDAILLAATFALTAAAQDKPNFSGKWVLDPQQSDFGDFPAPQSQVNVIDHKEPKIKLTQTIRGDAIPAVRLLMNGSSQRMAKKVQTRLEAGN
jgi:hypothetical protein